MQYKKGITYLSDDIYIDDIHTLAIFAAKTKYMFDRTQNET